MTWFRKDDKWLFTPEAQAAGLHGRALWDAVGATHCSGEDTDGMIDGRVLKMLAAAAEVNLRKATTALVDQALWHDHLTIEGCPPCHEIAKKYDGLKPGDYFHHGFLETNLDRAGKNDQIHRDREQRRRRIRRDKALVAKLRKRDRDLCQYCGTLTTWIDGNPDKRSKSIGEIDHVDPWGPDYDPANLVVACKGCNGRKGERTPAQWHAAGGRLLTRPVDRNTDPTWVDLGPTQIGPGSIDATDAEDLGAIPGSPRVARDSGRDLDRTGVEPGPGPDGGQVDPGPGPKDEHDDEGANDG